MKLLAFFAVIFTIFFFTSQINARVRPKIQTIQYAINLNWCGHIKKRCLVARQAFEVVRCETGNTFDIWAGYPHNEYWGIFQMGERERRLYGHGWNAWIQAKAARKYQKQAGWAPWPNCGRAYY